MDTAVEELPRLVIESLSPQLDGGRYPIKRLLDKLVDVGVNIFKDGHDLIAAHILYRPVGANEFRSAPLAYHFDVDRWYGSFKADRLGRWEYTVEAWPDRYGTFRSDLGKRLNAGQDVRSELLDGAEILLKLSRFLKGDASNRIKEAARKLSDPVLSLEERLRVAFADEVLETVRLPLLPGDATRLETLPLIVDRPEAGFSAWYELFPRSQGRVPGQHGTFADTAARLPEIAAMGFDVIYLPPIHPIGRTNRKGRNNALVAGPDDPGSPWAIGADEGGHDAIHPELGTLAQFERLVADAKEHGIEIALDFAIQCSPDHPWLKKHPEWFHRRPDGTLKYAENPPKRYQDIYNVNFDCDDWQALWNALRDVVLHWVARGVTVFRVDNPHTKPVPFWEWLIDEVRGEHPEVIFLAEAFTRPAMMTTLAKAGFAQSYTYFTWKNTRWELLEFMGQLLEWSEIYRPNVFVNTPDILHAYLQRGGRPAFEARLVLAGTLAPTYGIYSGFEQCENVPVREGSEEYLDSEKYEIKKRALDGPLLPLIGALNRARRENPALQRLDDVTFLETENEQLFAFLKRWQGNDVIVVVNLDPTVEQEGVCILPVATGLPPAYPVRDLLADERWTWHIGRNYVKLAPGKSHVLRIM